MSLHSDMLDRMCFYIPGPQFDKVSYLVESEGATELASDSPDLGFDEGKALICVVRHHTEETARYAYDIHEWAHLFSGGHERVWLVMDKDRADGLSGYKFYKQHLLAEVR